MPVTINSNGTFAGINNYNFQGSKKDNTIIQTVQRMGTACYSTTSTSFVEMSSDLRVTLPSVNASNSQVYIELVTKYRNAAHPAAKTKQYRPAYSTDGGGSFTNLNSHSIHFNTTADDHFNVAFTNLVNADGEAMSLSDGIIFSPLFKTSDASYSIQLGGCALGSTTTFRVIEILV